MPRGFSKVESRERVFLEKLRVLGAKIRKFYLLRAEILPKNKAENATFSNVENGGHMSGTLMVNW